MQALHMINLVKEVYSPFAGYGCCTIRRFVGKYQGLQPGDAIVMHHTDDAQTHLPAMATEFLKVSAMAIANLDTLLESHGKAGDMSLEEQKKYILSFYPLPEGEEHSPLEPFVAIYF